VFINLCFEQDKTSRQGTAIVSRKNGEKRKRRKKIYDN
jgi:hypothetical protein